MLLVTAHISQWDVKFAGKWDSALKGNSALRAHVARAAGIELAHREGQHVIHFLWDKLKFYDSITLADSAAGGKGLPARDTGFGLVDTHRRDVFKLATDTATSSLVVHPAFWQVVSRAALGPEVCCGNWSKHWGTWLLDLFAKSTSTQPVTNTSRMQLLHDAALIGKAVERRHSQAGPDPVLQVDASGKRQIPGKVDRQPPICLGTAATDLGIETAAGKRRCAAKQWKRMREGRRRAKRVNRLCKMNSEAQKLTMTGIHPVQIYGHTAQGASTAQVDSMWKNLKNGHGDGQNPSLRNVHSRMVFR